MLPKPIRTLLWYLKRPRFYPQLVNEIVTALHKQFFARARSRKEAAAWCRTVAVSMDDAMEQLVGTASVRSVEERFPDVFTEARKKADQCPVPMGGPANLDLLYVLAEAFEARSVIETGVAYGWSSLALLLSLHSRPDARLVSVDMPYPGLHNDLYVGCVVPEHLRPNWKIIRYPDRQAIPKALKSFDGMIDMCHYDSDKSWLGRMWAYKRLWAALRPGGYFVSDDIADNLAFKCFSESVAVRPVVVESDGKYVGILVKKIDT
ncbi:MAG: class I SAM-dependent methyltransferase [Planctomycetota bacterium]